MSTTNYETATPPVRANLATKLAYEHEERMAQASRSSEPSVSVECDDTAKGDTTPTVKLYAPLGCDLSALEAHAMEVARIAVQVHQDTRAAFPRTNDAATPVDANRKAAIAVKAAKARGAA